MDIFGCIWMCKLKIYEKASTDLKPINLHYIIMNWTGCCIFLWKTKCAVREAHRKNSELVTTLHLVLSVLASCWTDFPSYPHHSNVSHLAWHKVSGLSGDAGRFSRGSCLMFLSFHIHIRAMKNPGPIN